ncbi:isopeptide-forming domain-containing fimbrial protein [Enterococcus mundtii]|uniref:isopeptide-forming domain-containing fimbrial protein n=1 Tax=Enterococcus mundtii TaxID=53346 RepID=UPI000E02B448|nr:isopeptide-forming domain-containing fimbrial protein [Enterococcus mundtii]STE38111.1 cell wall surface anchor family protein [Enterococcus mundtii]
MKNTSKRIMKKRLLAAMMVGATVGGIATTTAIASAKEKNESKSEQVNNFESPTIYEKALGKSQVKSIINSLASSSYIPVQDDEETTVVNDKTVISSDYDFSAGFIVGKTTVEPIGEGWKDGLQLENEMASRGIHIDEKDIVKGETGVIYHHVSANGQDVDMKMTVKDFTGFSKQDGTLAMNVEDLIGSWINRMVDITFDVEFLKAGTNDVIPLTGFFTWSDIDWLQSITLDKNMMDHADGILVSSDSWLQTKLNEDGSKVFAEINNEGSDDLDPWAMFTVLFKDLETFTYTFSTNEDPNKELPDENDWVYSWQGNSAVKPAQSEVPAPSKVVSDSDELDVTMNTLDEMKEEFQFSISQLIPGELTQFQHQSFEMIDEVISELEITSEVKVVDETGEDRTDWFENKTEGNKVHFIAKEDTMANDDFYGHTYSFQFSAKVRAGENLDQYLGDDGNYHFPNEAKTIIDGEEKTTPPTDTTVKDYDTDPQKYNVTSDGEETTEAIQGEKGDKVSYSIRNQAPFGLAGKTFKLQDNVYKQVDIDGASVKVEVTDDNVRESQNERAIPTDADEEDLKVTLNKWIVKAEEYIKDEDQYDPVSIGTLKIYLETAKEDLAREDVSDKVLQTDIDALISAIQLLDAEVEEEEDSNTNDNNNSSSDYIDVKDANWTDITDQGNLVVDPDTGQITWTLEDGSIMAGKHYRLSFSGTLREDIDYAELDHDGEFAIVPNVVTETIGDNEKNTNEVDVLVPEKEEPVTPDPEAPEAPKEVETPKESTPVVEETEDTGAKVLPTTLPKTGVDTEEKATGSTLTKSVATIAGTTVSLFGYATFFKK